MKKVFYLTAMLMFVSLSVVAQDDIYFTPQKKQKKEKKVPAVQEEKENAKTEYRTYDLDDVVFNGTGVEPAEDEVVNDTLYIDENETFADGQGGEWINGFKGSTDEYDYASRMMRWRSPRTAIIVGSPLYWDVLYGPASFDWNVYAVGGWAYLTPTWSNPLYWDYRYDPTWSWGWNWGWHRPWYSWSYYGWGYPYYGWAGGWHHGWYDWHYGWHGGWHGHWGGWVPNSRTNIGYRTGGGRYTVGGRSYTTGRSRSVLSGDGTRYRTQDNARTTTNRTTGRVTGRTVRSRSDNNSSVRSTSTRQYRIQDNATGSRVNRTTTERTTSTYVRNADGRRTTYSRPSSTRTTEARSVRSYRESNPSGTVNRSTTRSYNNNSNSNSNSNTRSYSPSRSNTSPSRSTYSSGSFGGGNRSGGGSSGGGSRSRGR